MATELTKVRVPRATGDSLARQANELGIPVAAFLDLIAERGDRDAIFKAEREAIAADGHSPTSGPKPEIGLSP